MLHQEELTVLVHDYFLKNSKDLKQTPWGWSTFVNDILN